MSSLATAINVSGHDRDAIGVTVIDPADAELCARLIARHAKSPGDGDLLADVLGLDGEHWNDESRQAVRIMRLADEIGGRP